MGYYTRHILPKVIHWACKQGPASKQRQKVIPIASGKVLEIGVGSGLNLPFYNSDNVTHILGIDPAIEIWNQSQIAPGELSFEFEFRQAAADDIPSDNKSFDTVVFTYTLCSISSVHESFDEIRRVLKDNGKVIFCEHGKAPDAAVLKVQNLINPVWQKFSGGCRLNRDIPAIFVENGFRIDNLEARYIPGWRPASFNYWGVAKTS